MDIIRRFGRRVPGSNPGRGTVKCNKKFYIKKL